MSDFQITYKHPWLLLLIIPAVLLTLIPYFRLNKKYRFTRNRIASMSIHITAMVLAVNLLAGLGFSWQVPNEENEIILLVDTSDSGEDEREDRDEFVRQAVDICPEGCKIGIVKFAHGFDYSVELTSERDGVMEKYAASRDPDGSASSLADAIEYAATLFTNKETAKIVVISDGLQTDGDARLSLHGILSQGISVDTAYFGGDEGKDIQIMSAEIEDKDIVLGESFNVDLLIMSNSTESEEAAVLRLYDNGELLGQTAVGIKMGENEIPVSLTFDTRGMHELTFELLTDYELFGEPLGDDVKANNSYRTYVNLEEFENILIIERYEGEGAVLKNIIKQNKTVTDISVEKDIADFPKDIAEMAEYEQIILVNIAYSDMPPGFEALLHEYVYELGGGLFTVGGRNDLDAAGETVPHAYNRSDIENSVYFKNMLPVNAEDYTPPVAVMLVVDTSTSIKSTGKLAEALKGAQGCLDALHERDYCGIVSFSSASSERLSILPVSQRETISEAIRKLEDEPGGGTIFSDAIMKAGRALSVINDVERKHIIFITDGESADSYSDYERYIKDNVNSDITMSVIGLDPKARAEEEMQKAAAAGKGQYYRVVDASSIASTMHKDLTEEAIPEIEYGKGHEFSLTVKDKSNILAGIDAGSLPMLSGYYGTAAKKDATVPLMGKYVPIYATHKYGRGTVGSFMCDLGGEWSDEFAASPSGKALIMNIVESIFPARDVRVDSIKYEVREDNYLHWVNVHGTPEGQTVGVTVTPVSSHLQHLYGEIDVNAAELGRRFTFSLTEAGLYKITVTSYDGEGNAVEEIPVYRAFSYSKEYDSFSSGVSDGEELMSDIAARGGDSIDDPVSIFTNLKKTLARSFDPRIILIIAVIVLVLLDVAVRKFKFKWLHEIIRERKNEKR